MFLFRWSVLQPNSYMRMLKFYLMSFGQKEVDTPILIMPGPHLVFYNPLPIEFRYIALHLDNVVELVLATHIHEHSPRQGNIPDLHAVELIHINYCPAGGWSSCWVIERGQQVIIGRCI